MATTEPPPSGRRKRRWGDQGPADGAGGEEDGAKKSRFSANPPANGASTATTAAAGASANNNGQPADPKARAAALQASIQARLAALKARTGGAAAAKPAPPATTAGATAQKSAKRPPEAAVQNDKSAKRAKVFELDMTSTAPTRLLEKQQREEQLRSNAAPAKPAGKINPYLIDTVAAAATEPSPKIKKDKKGMVAEAKLGKKPVKEEEVVLDNRLAPTSKGRLHSRPLNFVAPGTYIALGEKKREQAARAAESGFISGRKAGNVVKSVGMAAVIGEEGGASYYGAGEAGIVMEKRLPARVDAPELELDDYAGKKKILTSVLDVDLEKNDVAVAATLRAATSSMPYAMEWWDAELLPSKLRKELAGEEGKAIAARAKKRGVKKDDDAAADAASVAQQYKEDEERHAELTKKCYQHASLSHSKTHALLQHPVPILTPAQRAAKEAAKNKPPTLHLTKAERKRHRKLRRAERLREQQDLQAAGLIEPPEPRLTLSNYMKVLGDQAVLDPSKMEAKVMEQVHARKVKHEKMNAERKLTKEQKAAKHARKLQEDTSQSVKVALFYVKDMSHPYHRAKVDLNAQQNGITGGVLECEGGGFSLVVAEGGEKAIKRYTRLMTVRMRWRGEDFYEDQDESEEELMVGEDEEEGGEGGEKKEKRKKFNPNNECELIWTGMAVKRAFHSFMFQAAEDAGVARRILEAKGVAHYWDLAAAHVEGKAGVGGVAEGDGALRFRLGDGGSSTGDGYDAMP